MFAIKPERPSPSSLISGVPSWGVLDYAVHTFALVSRIRILANIRVCGFSHQ